MKAKNIIVLVLLLTLCLTTAYAGNSKRIGTAGGQELLIPVGSRGTAMGGSVVSNTWGLESIYWNPAGLASLEGTEAMFSHLPYIADINVNFGAVGTTIENVGTLAFSAKVVAIGDMQETTNEYPNGTGRIFSPTLSVIGLTYARQLTSNVAFGATGMLIRESIFEVGATGAAFDVGFIYDPRWQGIKLGVAIKNYGPTMRFSGRGFDRNLNGYQASPKNASSDLPSHIDLGISYNFLNRDRNSLTASGNYRSNNFQEDFYQGGLEYGYNERYFLRGGYNYSKQDDYIYGLSLGAGISVPIGGTSKLTFEYSWNKTDVFEDNQYFTLKVNM
ncbi:MAG: PorV/PorQ family protein [Candidatus Zixiibacteriota bacterium]